MTRFGPGTLGGYTHIGKWYRDVLRSWPPFFHASLCSLAYQFTLNASLMCPHFQCLEKFCIFSLVLAKIYALKTQTFKIFIPKTPSFFKENPLPRPYFGNPCGTHPPKKVECPPPPPGPGPGTTNFSCTTNGFIIESCQFIWQYLPHTKSFKDDQDQLTWSFE